MMTALPDPDMRKCERTWEQQVLVIHQDERGTTNPVAGGDRRRPQRGLAGE
jgi:hypothetical protein